MRRAICITFMGVAVTACVGQSANSQAQLDSVQAQIANGVARLDAVRRDIATSEAAAMQAKERAKFEECHADQAGITANAKVSVAACYERQAQHAECVAHGEAHTADAGVAGCLGGILVAALTGGAAAPLALGGCAVGAAAGEATRDECPAAACSTDLATAINASLTARRLSSFPACGGLLGVQLGVPRAAAQIQGVVPGTSAADRGLAPGDTITAIAGQPTPTAGDVAAAIERHPGFDIVRVDFTRQGRPLAIVAVLAPRRQ
jgi:hypothetical protein